MTPPDNTPELLKRFIADRSEAAFRQLIETHTGMVLASARRRLNGNEAEAREVTQTVFSELARRAASLRRDVVLGAWLHRVTCTQAAMLIRAESRRRKHEANAAAMIASEQSGEEDSGWTEMSPVLDDELNRLPSADRVALVLRFFERRGLREVGATLGTTEEGARKRVSRALEKLRRRFVRRGLTVPGAGSLAVLLTSRASEAAAPELTGTVAHAALAQSAAVPAGFVSGAAAAFILKGAAVAAVVAMGFVGGRVSALPPAKTPAVAVVPHPAPPPEPAPLISTAPPPPAPPTSHLIGLAASANAMLDRIARASVPELAAIFDEYHRDLTPALFDLLCQRWASLDSGAALKYLRHTHDTDVDRFFGAWAKTDFPSALRVARAEQGHWRSDSVQAVLASLLPQDPQAFLAAAASEQASHVSPASVDLAIRTIAEAGIDRALEVFGKLKAPHLRTSAARTIAALQAANDPNAALTWAKSLSDAPERDAALRGALSVMAAADPDSAVPHLSLIDSTARWDDPLSIAVRAMMKQDPLRGLEWAAENFPAPRMEAAVSFVKQAEEVGVVDRLRVSRRMRERLAASGTPFALRMFDQAFEYLSFSNANPIADMQALAAESPDPLRDQWLRSLARKLRLEDSGDVVRAIQSLPPDALTAVVPQALIVVKDDRDALSGLLPLLEGNPRAPAVLRALGESMTVTSAEQAQAALANIAEPSRPDVAYGIANGWAWYDPDAALTWAETLPDSGRAAAFEAIAMRRAVDDALTVSQWIDTMPRGALRDGATRGLCGQLANSEPDSAWTWAMTVTDPAVRLETMSGVYYEWAKKNRSAASAALTAARLSAPARRTVEQFKPERSWWHE